MKPAETTDSGLARIKAETLIESLDWLREFHGRTVVIKFGGNAMVDEALQKSFAEDMAYLRFVGIRPVVVHGGGPQITAKLAELGIETEFKAGLRVTTKESIKIIRDVLRESVGAGLVQLIEQAGAEGKVLSGEDKALFLAEKTKVDTGDGEVDLGLVGEVKSVNPRAVLDLISVGKIPVISSIAPDVKGDLLNVNADLAAASLAVALGAEKLIVLTDVPGLYSDWPDRSSLISEITSVELRELIPTLESGMVPKMTACLEAVDGGVPKAHIIDGRDPHSILLEIFTESGVGTQVSK
jgi:acetylglutamate kinase